MKHTHLLRQPLLRTSTVMATSNTEKIKVAVLGCGLMGTALLQGWLRDIDSRYTFAAYVRSDESLKRLKREMSSLEAADKVYCGVLPSTLNDVNIIILGVPPKEMSRAVDAAGLANMDKPVLLVSLLAGVSISQLRSRIPSQNVQLARVIPTLAAKIGDSVTLIGSNSESQPETTRAVHDLFAGVGSIQDVPETLMNEATAIGAAVNALAIIAIDAVTDSAVAEGVPRDTALALAAKSIRSVCGLMLNGDMGPEAVKASMSTPGGITINAVVNLEAAAKPGIAGATRAAIQYARKMND